MFRSLVVLSFALAMLEPLARADVPPTDSERDPCSIANEKGPEALCDLCRTSVENADGCKARHATDGYKFRCKRVESSRAWSEIWCNNDSRPGCASAATPALATILVALFLQRRRNRAA